MAKNLTGEAHANAGVVALIVGASSFAVNSAIPTAAAIEEIYDLPFAAQFLASVFATGYGFGHIAVGLTAHRFDLRIFLLLSLAGFAVASVLTAGAETAELLLFWRFWQGAFVSACPIIGRSLAWGGRSHEHSAKVLSSATSIFSWMPVAAPVLASAAIAVFDWRIAYLLAGAYGVLVFLVLGANRRLNFNMFSSHGVAELPLRIRISNLVHDKQYSTGMLLTVLLFASFLCSLAVSSDYAVGKSGAETLRPAVATTLIAAAFAVGGAVSRVLLIRMTSSMVLVNCVNVYLLSVAMSLICAYFFDYGIVQLPIAMVSATAVGATVPNATLFALQNIKSDGILGLALIGSGKMIFAALVTSVPVLFVSDAISQTILVAVFVSLASIFLIRNVT